MLTVALLAHLSLTSPLLPPEFVSLLQTVISTGGGTGAATGAAGAAGAGAAGAGRSEMSVSRRIGSRWNVTNERSSTDIKIISDTGAAGGLATGGTGLGIK